MKESINNLEEKQSNNMGYVGIGAGVIAIAIAINLFLARKFFSRIVLYLTLPEYDILWL